jgi:hypothetical protein
MTIGMRASRCSRPAGVSLHGALLAAKAAGHTHVIVDGTLIHTDRISTPGPTTGVDLWWSGKHKHHGGNIQVVSAPDGWPLWTSDVRSGREHDMSAARADPDVLARVTDWVSDGALALADLGYEGEPEIFTIPFKKPKHGALTIDTQSYNALHSALRCLGERANSLLKTTSAPRGAVLYPPRNGERLEEVSLDLMAYLNSKERGDRSLPENQRSCPGVWDEALGDPRDMATAGLQKSQSPEGAT